MGAFEKFIESDLFFPVLIGLLLLLIIVFVVILILDRKREKKYIQELREELGSDSLTQTIQIPVVKQVVVKKQVEPVQEQVVILLEFQLLFQLFNHSLFVKSLSVLLELQLLFQLFNRSLFVKSLSVLLEFQLLFQLFNHSLFVKSSLSVLLELQLFKFSDSQPLNLLMLVIEVFLLVILVDSDLIFLILDSFMLVKAFVVSGIAMIPVNNSSPILIKFFLFSFMICVVIL